MGKGTWIALGVVGAILLVLLGAVGSAVGTYNKLVNEREGVDAQGRQVDVAYQRAFRLVPDIVNLTEQYFEQEAEVQTRVAALRSGASVAQNGTFEQKDQFADDLAATRAIIIQVVNENYPNLKANELYQTTINEIINTENKIAAEKIRYNDRVQGYNAHRQQCCIPVLVANAFGFHPKEYIGFENRPNTSELPPGEQL